MAGDENEGYSIIENAKFRSDIDYLCREIRIGRENIKTILDVIYLTLIRKPHCLHPVPDYPDMRFVITGRVKRDGIHVPSLGVLVKITEPKKEVELLSLKSRDVCL
jgi:hypothetical protein